MNWVIIYKGYIDNNIYKNFASNAVFIGVGERSREGKELYDEMKDADLLNKIGIVFGQMGDNATSRSKAIYSGLTIAEYLRDEKKQDVLLFIDNIYRFVQAKSEISTELEVVVIPSIPVKLCSWLVLANPEKSTVFLEPT